MVIRDEKRGLKFDITLLERSLKDKDPRVPISIRRKWRKEGWKPRCSILFSLEKNEEIDQSIDFDLLRQIQEIDKSFIRLKKIYQPIDFFIQMAIYAIQKKLISGIDCVLPYFRKYTLKKIKRAIREDDLRRGLKYIIGGWLFPYNPVTFIKYVRETLSWVQHNRLMNEIYPGTWRKDRYESKINPEKATRQEILAKRIREDIGQKAVTETEKNRIKEKNRKRLYRELKIKTLDEILLEEF